MQIIFLFFSFEKLLDGKFANEVSHEVDGLIFQPVAEVMFVFLFTL